MNVIYYIDNEAFIACVESRKKEIKLKINHSTVTA